jgi:hypothetical protein
LPHDVAQITEWIKENVDQTGFKNLSGFIICGDMIFINKA